MRGEKERNRQTTLPHHCQWPDLRLAQLVMPVEEKIQLLYLKTELLRRCRLLPIVEETVNVHWHIPRLVLSDKAHLLFRWCQDCFEHSDAALLRHASDQVYLRAHSPQSFVSL